MLHRAGSKVFPISLPQVLKDSDSGTGDFDRRDGRNVFGSVLVDHSSTKLHKKSRHQHRLLVHAAPGCKPDGGPGEVGLHFTGRIQDQKGKSIVGQKLAGSQEVGSFRKGGNGNTRRQRTLAQGRKRHLTKGLTRERRTRSWQCQKTYNLTPRKLVLNQLFISTYK